MCGELDKSCNMTNEAVGGLVGGWRVAPPLPPHDLQLQLHHHLSSLLILLLLLHLIQQLLALFPRLLDLHP